MQSFEILSQPQAGFTPRATNDGSAILPGGNTELIELSTYVVERRKTLMYMDILGRSSYCSIGVPPSLELLHGTLENGRRD
ncbi:hypothetical protein KC354_g164 [Hortaea werneckii]|nr:hypothetical protein KC354_g164 [Hortaea werneckii]